MVERLFDVEWEQLLGSKKFSLLDHNSKAS